MSDVSFVFSGRKYKVRILADDAVVFGLGLNPKIDVVHVLKRSSIDKSWVRPTDEKPTALGRAALRAVGLLDE